MQKRDLTIERQEAENAIYYAVFEHGVYERSSVLAGQHRRQLIECFDTLDEAVEEYPDATESESTRTPHHPMSDIAPSWFDPADAGEEW